MAKLTKVLNKISRCKVLVIGDFLLDTYTIGQASRISPEAPVAVLRVEREEHRPGGAGNVVLNLLSLGAEVASLGRIGIDVMGQNLKDALENEGTDVAGIVVQQGYRTPVKNRVIASGQQIVRIDHEQVIPLPHSLEKETIERLPVLMRDVSAVAISDYGKGFLTHNLLQAVIQEGIKRKIPVIADPKGIDFTKYFGVTILKPNLKETYAAANLMPSDSLDLASERLLTKTQAQTLMVTRSEAGISLFFQDGTREDFPVRIKGITDVTGAGDTVLAVLAWGVGNGLTIQETTELSNIAAGIAVEKFGCARVSLAELARRLLEMDTQHKVFDVGHLAILTYAMNGKQSTLLSVTSQKGLTSTIFQKIGELKTENNALIVFVRDAKPCKEFIEILTSLHSVDFVIVNHESLNKLWEHLMPNKMFMIDDEECRELELCLEEIK